MKSKNNDRRYAILTSIILWTSLIASPVVAEPVDPAVQTAKTQLGQKLYFDTRLSQKGTLACAVCHSPGYAFIDARSQPEYGRLVALGDDGHSRGNRNVPTASYAASSPKFHYNKKLKEWVGGQFWDGRAPTLADQAGGPPLADVEMNMPNKQLNQ